MSSEPIRSMEEDKQTESSVDIAKVMAEIRARIERDLESNKDRQRPLKPFNADFNPETGKVAGELDASESLRYLNTHYENGLRLDLNVITSHRPGLIGRLIVGIKRKALSLLWNHLIKYYVQSEKEYQAHLVKYLNEVSKYIDGRDASNFWELIRKIDYDVTKSQNRIERINDEQTGTIRSSERRMFDELSKLATDLNSLRNDTVLQNERLKVIESVSSGLERVVSKISGVANAGSAMATNSSHSEMSPPDPRYILLENRFRGSEQEISRRLSFYPDLFTTVPGPVLEIGPGRGELQALFKSRGIASYGIDLDRAMVETAVSKGLDVRLGDALVHLKDLADGSLGGLIAIQVVEHLTKGQIEELCVLARKKIKRGGKVIFETINPRSLLALSSNYFRDPTHVWPLHPDTLSFSMTLAGLKVNEVKLLSPVDDGAKLKPLPIEDFMTPRWAFALEAINRNITQLNDLLYGYQDYCVIAEVE